MSEGLIAIAEVLNTTAITDLNIAGNNIAYNSEYDKSEDGINKLAAVLEDNGALSKMTFTGNGDGGDDGDPVTVETGMTEADFSNKKLGPAGAIILAAWIEHK